MKIVIIGAGAAGLIAAGNIWHIRGDVPEQDQDFVEAHHMKNRFIWFQT